MTGWSLAQTDPGRVGNGHSAYAFQGTYPCADGGWIAITCKSDAQLENLCGLAGIGGNGHQEGELDEQLGAWTTGQDKHALMHLLQRSGIPAGAVLNGPDLLNDPHLASRGALLAQDRPGLGVKHYPAQPYRFNRTAPQPQRRAPMLGEHLEEVLSHDAGLTSDEIAELVIDDVTGTVPIAARGE